MVQIKRQSQSAVANNPAGYINIALELIDRADIAPVDIFVSPGKSEHPVLYCREGLPLSHEQLASIEEMGIRECYIKKTDLHELGGFLRDAFLGGRKSVSVAEQFSAMQLVVASEIEHAARIMDSNKFVSLASTIGRDIAAFITSRNVMPNELFSIARHDFSTFVHVTNVASYSVMLAQRIGIRDIRDLELIAAAAMLHDLGKQFIPVSILNKAGPLDANDWDIIQLHPTRGYVELCDRTDLTFEQLMVVYQHHEHVDGGGYPVGVTGRDITPWAKMVAVVDVFDALTGCRPYRHPITSRQALDFLRRNAGTHFDEEIVQCWEESLS